MANYLTFNRPPSPTSSDSDGDSNVGDPGEHGSIHNYALSPLSLQDESRVRRHSWGDRPVALCGRILSPYFTRKDFAFLFVINAIMLFAFTVLGYFLKRTFDEHEPDMGFAAGLITLTSAGVQATLELNSTVVERIEKRIATVKPTVEERNGLERVVHYINLSSIYRERGMNVVAFLAIKIQLVIWNGGLNIPLEDVEASQTLYLIDLFFCTSLVARDFFNLFKIPQGHHVESLRATDTRYVPINERLSPSPNNLPGKVVMYLGLAGTGMVFMGVGGFYEQDVTGLGQFSKMVGAVGVFNGVGYFLYQGFEWLWKRQEQNWLRNDHYDPSTSIDSNPKIPPIVLFLRWALNFLQRTSIEFIVISPALFSNPSSIGDGEVLGLAAVLGGLEGMMDNYLSKKFAVLTSDDLTRIQSESFVEGTEQKKIDVRIIEASMVAFYGLFTAFFSYGLDVSGNKERVEIAVLMATTAIGAVYSRLVVRRFQPGQHGRVYNEGVYDFYNRYKFMVPYYICDTIGGTTGIGVSDNDSFKYGVGLAALGALGFVIGGDDGYFREGASTSPFFRAQVFRVWANAFKNGPNFNPLPFISH